MLISILTVFEDVLHIKLAVSAVRYFLKGQLKYSLSVLIIKGATVR